MYVYTIYYIFALIIVVSFVTGLILNIIESRQNKNNVAVLKETGNMKETVATKEVLNGKFSNTVGVSKTISTSDIENSDDIEILDEEENDDFQKGLFSSVDDSVL